MYSKEKTLGNLWSTFLGVDDVENLEDIEKNDVIEKDIESAQMFTKDMYVYKSSPVWEELIFVTCRFCNSSLLPHSVTKHVESRHTGGQQFEKDPEFYIFRKVAKKSPPLPSTPRASPAALGAPYTTGYSTDSPQLAEQFLGWPNSPHGAYQQSPLNMSSPMVRVKPENKVKVVMPGMSILARKNAPELLPKPEPYNQSFSFSSSPNVMPSVPSTSYDIASMSAAYDIAPASTSYDSPSSSTSYDVPSTSRRLLPCQSLEASFEQSRIYSPVLQSASTLVAPSTEERPREKAPLLEKLVLRRVLQTDPKTPAEGRLSGQGLKGIAKNRKDSQETYFMVVKSKDRQKNLMATNKEICKQANVVHHEKDKVDHKMKKLENVRNKLINQLFHELQSVKKKLDQCNRSKQEIERELTVVKANLEETKRTTDFQNEALLKQNAKFENEIQILKLRNEELTNSLVQAQLYRGLGNAWNFADNHMSKQFQAIEEQKIELQRRIEELESESRELKNSSTIERGRFDAKLRQYFKIISDLKRRHDEQVAKSEELKLQRDFYEKHLSPEVCYQVKSQLAAFQHQQEVYEVYPGLLTPQPTPPTSSPAMSLADTLLSDIQNINYMSPFQSLLSPDSSEVFHPQQQQHPQQPEVIHDEEVS